MHPRQMLRELERAMPDGAMVSTDIGNICSVSNSYLRFERPRSMFAAMSFGNCGYAFPTIIGAKVAAPDRPAIAYVGDGAWGMSFGELQTCVRENIPVTAVVFNNGQWGAEKKNHVDFYDNRFVGVNLDKQPSWAAVAQGDGRRRHARSTSVSDVGPALRAAAAAQREGRTTVLEMMVTRELGDPFRRDALALPVRHLAKYKATRRASERPVEARNGVTDELPARAADRREAASGKSVADARRRRGLVARARAAQRIADAGRRRRSTRPSTAAGWAIVEPARNRALAEIAVRDTGLGNVADKIAKNRRKTMGLLRDLQGARSVGVIAEDPERGLVEIARPVGVVAAITPSTNPGATPANNIINALKGRNAIVLAPSPKGQSTLALLLRFVARASSTASARRATWCMRCRRRSRASRRSS